MSDPEVHTVWHDAEQDEIIAIETELGVAPSGGFSTVRARLDALDPDGDGTSSAWTPAWTNLTVGSGTVNARKAEFGPLVYFFVQLVFAADTSITGAVQLGFSGQMSAVFAPSNQEITSQVEHVDTSAGQSFTGKLDVANASTFNVRYLRDDTGSAANPIRELGIATMAPFTWAATDRINIAGMYLSA